MSNDHQTVNISDMPEDYLVALLEGRLSFDEALGQYGGPMLVITEIEPETPTSEEE